MMFDDIENDIQDIFDEVGNDHISRGVDEDSRLSYDASSSQISHISTLGELFAEYFLQDTHNSRNIPDFLKNNELDAILTEEKFMLLMKGDVYLPDDSLAFFRLKMPFPVTEHRLYNLNAKVRNNSPHAQKLLISETTTIDMARMLQKQKLDERRERQNGYKKKSRLKYREEILARFRWRYHNDPEYRQKIKDRNNAFYAKMSQEQKEKKYAYQRDKYNTDFEYRKKRQEKCLRYYQKQRERMAADPEYAAKVREQRRIKDQARREAKKLSQNNNQEINAATKEQVVKLNILKQAKRTK